jgi:hypothetical protein
MAAAAAAPPTAGRRGRRQAEPPTDVPLKDPKDWKLAGKRLARLDTVDKTTGKLVYGMDLKLPGMLNAAIRPARCSAARSRASTPRRVSRARRAQGGARRRQRGGGGGRHLVARQDRAGRAADRVGPGPACQGLVGAAFAPDPEGRPGRAEAVSATAWRRRSGAGRGAAHGRGGLQLPAPEPRHDGADERHRALDTPSAARSGRPRRTAKPRWPPPPRPPACRRRSARSTSCTWAAASAAAARCTTGCARRC